MTADDRRTCPLCGTRVHLDTVDCPVCGAGLAGPDDDEFDDDGPWAFVGGQEVEPARGSAWQVVAAIGAGVVGVAALIALVWFVVVPRLSPSATAAPGGAPSGAATSAPVPGETPDATAAPAPGGVPAATPGQTPLTPPAATATDGWTTMPGAPSSSPSSSPSAASTRGSGAASTNSSHGSTSGQRGPSTGSSRGPSSRGPSGSSHGTPSRGASTPNSTPSKASAAPQPLPTAEDPSEYPPGTNEHGFFYETDGIPGALSHMGTLTKVTSPEFGRNVAIAYNKLGHPFAAAKVRAYSPNLRTYIVMDCVPYPDKSVGCVGGDNAQVEMW